MTATTGGMGGYNVGAVVGTIHLNVAGAIKSANQFTESVNKIPAATQPTVRAIGSLTTGSMYLTTRLASLVGPLALVAGALYGVRVAVEPLIGLITKGIGAIDEMKSSAAGMAVALMAVYPKASFDEAYKAAQKLTEVVERLDVTFSGSGDQLRMMLDAMVNLGQGSEVMKLLTDDTGKTSQAFVAFAEALKASTRGQNFQIQVFQELRAVFQGQRLQMSALYRQLQLMDPEIAKHMKLWQQQGTLMENLQPLLQNYIKGSAKIADTLGAQRESWGTIIKRMLRASFEINEQRGAYRDLTNFQKQLNALFYDQEGTLTGIGQIVVVVLQGAWESIWMTVSAITGVLGSYRTALEESKNPLRDIVAYFLTLQNTAALMVETFVQAITLVGTLVAAIGTGITAYYDILSGHMQKAIGEVQEAKSQIAKAWEDLNAFPERWFKTQARVEAFRRGGITQAPPLFEWPYTAKPKPKVEDGAKKAAKDAKEAQAALKEETELYEQLTAAIEENATQRALALSIAGKEPALAKEVLFDEIEALLVLKETIAAKDVLHKGEKAYAEYHRAIQKQLADIDKKVLNDRLGYIEIERKEREEDAKEQVAAAIEAQNAEIAYTAAELQASQRIRDAKVAYAIEAGTVTLQQQLKATEQDIAFNDEALRRFIGNNLEREVLEQRRLDLLVKRRGLQRSINQEELAAIDEEIAKTGEGYDKKLALIDTELKKQHSVDEILQLQTARRQTMVDWQQKDLAVLDQQGLTLEMQRDLVTDLMWKWQGNVQMLTLLTQLLQGINVQLHDSHLTVEGIVSDTEIWKQGFLVFFDSLHENIEKFGIGFRAVIRSIGDMLNSLLDAFRRKLLDILATQAAESVIGTIAKWLPLIALQHGGVVTKPTLAVVGETGPEAVVPLRDISAMLQRGIASMPMHGNFSYEGAGGIGSGAVFNEGAIQQHVNLSVASLSEWDLYKLAERMVTPVGEILMKRLSRVPVVG